MQYKDQSVLEDECLEGRQLGFTGKVSVILIIIFIDWLDSNQQAIHPAQVPTIQSTYVPSSQGMYFCSLHERPELMIDFMLVEILRAAKILHQLRLAHSAERGAVGLEGEMVDAPMLKQVCDFLHKLQGRINVKICIGRENHCDSKSSWPHHTWCILSALYKYVVDRYIMPNNDTATLGVILTLPLTVASELMISDLERYVSDNVLTVSIYAVQMPVYEPRLFL